MDERTTADLNPPQFGAGAPIGTVNANSQLFRIIIIALIIAILVVAGLIFKAAFLTPEPTPRTMLENELIGFQSRIKQNPKDYEAHTGLGIVYMTTGKYGAAINELKIAAGIKPDYNLAYMNLGLAYSKIGRYKDAIKALDTANKVGKPSPTVYFSKGKVYLLQKKYDEAIKSFKESLKIMPLNAETHYYLGIAYEKSGNKTAALSAYRKALSYVPDYDEARKAIDKLQSAKK